MSAEVVLSWPAWAREQRKLGASARACLREIAVLADDRGAAIVEIAWLAQAVDRSERTVWRGLAALEERGLIVREERREEGHRAASRFQLVRDPARAINKARARVEKLGVDVDTVASCAIDLNDDEGLRTALAQACSDGWHGPSANRLALTLLEHGRRQFGRIASRQARYEAMSVSTALADVLTLAWIELRTSAMSMIKARSPGQCGPAQSNAPLPMNRSQAPKIERQSPSKGSSLKMDRSPRATLVSFMSVSTSSPVLSSDSSAPSVRLECLPRSPGQAACALPTSPRTDRKPTRTRPRLATQPCNRSALARKLRVPG